MFKFSLRTLVLAPVAIACVMWFIVSCRPWQLAWLSRPGDAGVCGVAFLRDGMRAVSCGVDGQVRVWNVRTGALLSCLKTGGASARRCVFSDDRELVTLICSEGLWVADTVLGRAIWIPAPSLLFGKASRFRDPGGLRVVGASRDGRVLIWNEKGALLLSFPVNDPALLDAVVSPDGRQLVARTSPCEVFFWDLETGGLLAELDRSQVEGLWEMNQQWDREGRLYHGALGVFRANLSPQYVSYDAKRKISFADRPEGITMLIDDAKTGGQIAALVGDIGPLQCFEFSPVEDRAIGGSQDGTVVVWERQRPEEWWGLAWLPQFWLLVISCVAFIWSMRDDRGSLNVSAVGNLRPAPATPSGQEKAGAGPDGKR